LYVGRRPEFSRSVGDVGFGRADGERDLLVAVAEPLGSSSSGFVSSAPDSSFSKSTSSRMFSRNQGSIFDASWMSSVLQPAR
jgi:hypothetical protein